MADGEWLQLHHGRVGDVRVHTSRLLHFAGLPGFPHARRFALIERDRNLAFAWMVCLDDLDLAFVVADPRQLVPGYQPEPRLADLRAVGAESPAEVALLAIANLRGRRPTLNLAAPLVVHPRTRRGVQAILEDDRFSIHEPIELIGPIGPQPEPGSAPSDGVESPDV